MTTHTTTGYIVEGEIVYVCDDPDCPYERVQGFDGSTELTHPGLPETCHKGGVGGASIEDGNVTQ